MSHESVFASVPYLNAAPLAHCLSEIEGVRVLYDVPSALAELLRTGRVDAALLPVADRLLDPGLQMIDGLGVCADGAVESVLLKCERPIQQVRTVARDPASRTSNALAHILLEEHLGLAVEMVDEPEGADAAVLIGDEALVAPPAPHGDLDLATLWKEMTGLPFVFAVWVHRADHPEREKLATVAHEARRLGEERTDELAARYAGTLGLPAARCRDYLTDVIYYDVGPREREAMATFRKCLIAREGPP
jgi:chorismate dehydratase